MASGEPMYKPKKYLPEKDGRYGRNVYLLDWLLPERDPGGDHLPAVIWQHCVFATLTSLRSTFGLLNSVPTMSEATGLSIRMLHAWRRGHSPLRRYALEAFCTAMGDESWLPKGKFKHEFMVAARDLGMIQWGAAPDPSKMLHAVVAAPPGTFPDAAGRPTFEPVTTTPADHGQQLAAAALTQAVLAARAATPVHAGEIITVNAEFEPYGEYPAGIAYNPYTSVYAGLDIDADDPTIDVWIRLSPNWFEGTQRYGGIVIDGLFPMSFDPDAWNEDHPTRITALRAIPEALLPDGRGEGWMLGVSDATITWDPDGAPHAQWVIGDDRLHDYADEYGRQIGQMPARDIYAWNMTDDIAEFEANPKKYIANVARRAG